MSAQLTEEQKGILKHFEDLQKDLHYLPISDLYLPSSNKQIAIQSPLVEAQPILRVLLEHESPQLIFDSDHKKVQDKLQEYKAKSNLIHSVSNLIHEYDINFRHLRKQRDDLLQLIQVIHKDTSELIQKQKKYIDLANSVKEALDYYTLMDKFQFNWACEPSGREVFEDQLQPLLSELTDGIEFFSSNSNYSNSKKYLTGLTAAKTKVTSFTKSFFIKLLNKQYGFSIKNAKVQLHKNIDSFYPKSKPKFLGQFLACYPQFHRELKVILLSARQLGNEGETNSLVKRQAQIEQFILNQNSLSLITYLQKNIPEVYEQVILKFISFYRINFHENFHRNMDFKLESAEQKYEDHFRLAFIRSAMIITFEAAYLEYCFKPCSEIARQYARGTLAKITQFYSSFLVRVAKQPGKNKDPFLICNEVTFILEEYAKFLRNYTSRQYQTYVLGAIVEHVELFGVDQLKSIIEKIGNKIINQLEPVCQNMLPKFKQTADKVSLTKEIEQFVKLIPNLSYCPSQAEKYLISSLDSITKSIKEVSNRIQSRLECYAWNIEMFALIDASLEKLPYSLIKKQMKLDVGQTSRMIQRVKGVNRTDNLVKYASELFSIIKTGVPTLSELTLDFNTFVREYYRELKDKFVKDMVFVHAKNLIEFLQELKAAGPDQALKLCEDSMVRNLQSSYKLSIENFTLSSNKIMELRQKQFGVFQEGEQILLGLLKEVQEALLDLMGMLYVEVSKYSKETDKFENIGEIRSKFSLTSPANRLTE